MRFWDASAIVPLCLKQPEAEIAASILKADPEMAVWWASAVECWSAFARLKREKAVNQHEETSSLKYLAILRSTWKEILPEEGVRDQAARLLRLHPLRAADALQLAAALVWTGGPPPAGTGFVTFDWRLGETARLEGFAVFPVHR